jgi:hypothetical protein
LILEIEIKIKKGIKIDDDKGLISKQADASSGLHKNTIASNRTLHLFTKFHHPQFAHFIILIL